MSPDKKVLVIEMTNDHERKFVKFHCTWKVEGEERELSRIVDHTEYTLHLPKQLPDDPDIYTKLVIAQNHSITARTLEGLTSVIAACGFVPFEDPK
jgi:hypothetical protein